MGFLSKKKSQLLSKCRNGLLLERKITTSILSHEVDPRLGDQDVGVSESKKAEGRARTKHASRPNPRVIGPDWY
jgi:hypothetical protein